MDQTAQILALIGIAALGILAVVVILRRDRVAAQPPRENPYAMSTEGMKRCPSCGTGNLVTDATCSNCGRKLPG
ncbi:MAG TPA: zinc-ribbon domain-containing protein [Methylomirabilota bacterium]|nr:zinc-ribbon domain-containing protein [Methylomirabilota bacterium]